MTEADEETIRHLEEPYNVAAVSAFSYCWQQLKLSFKYALWVLLITAVMGVLYGIVSGIIIQPAVFGIAYITVMVMINFVVALLCILFNIIFLAPFKKGSRMLVKYFSLSTGFCVVFMLCYELLMNTGLHFF